MRIEDYGRGRNTDGTYRLIGMFHQRSILFFNTTLYYSAYIMQ